MRLSTFFVVLLSLIGACVWNQSASAAVATHGLSATYFDNVDFTGTAVKRVDRNVAFDWDFGSPDKRIAVETFSARWTGYLTAPTSGTYQLITSSDDGVRLWLNGKQRINHWGQHNVATDTANVSLIARVPQPIRIDYTEYIGHAVMKLQWKKPDGTVSVIPSSAFSTSRSLTAPVAATTIKKSPTLYLGAVARTDLVDDAAYTNAYHKYGFTSVTPQDVMTFKHIESTKGQYDWSGADRMVNWATANKLRIRGHNLLWYADVPDWVKTSSNQEVTAAVKAHIQAEVGRYKGKVTHWDVVNEGIDDFGGPRKDDIWRQKLGPDYIALAFQWAHEADPSAQLYYNEYHIESTKESQGSYSGKWNSMIAMIKDFKARNIRIDGIGFQAHSQFESMGNGAEILANVKAIGALGLHVEMTEVDIRDIPGNDEAAHAARFAEIGKACKDSNGICTGVTTWGLNDGQAYVPAGTNALTFYDNLTPKPSYYALTKAMGLL